MEEPPQNNIKLVVVGNSHVGETKMLLVDRGVSSKYQIEHIPPKSNEFEKNLKGTARRYVREIIKIKSSDPQILQLEHQLTLPIRKEDQAKFSDIIQTEFLTKGYCVQCELHDISFLIKFT